MNNKHDKTALYIIANAGFADDIVDLAREEGIAGATIMRARGTGAGFKTFAGITVDTEKDMIVCVTDKQSADKAMAAIKEKMGVKTPAHCVCYTMPVEKTVGITLLDEHPDETKP
jgi:nitrogen regulatory protein PII